jgi:hypothetical protein
MALTNAERQARYRARLKRNASTEALGQRVHRLVDEAVEALWIILNRPSPDGQGWAEIEGIGSLADYRRMLALDPGQLASTCRDLLWVSHLLEDDEKLVLQALVDVSDALAMTPRPR